MDEHVIYAAAAVLGGIIIGTVAGGVARRAILRSQKRRDMAAPAAAVIFWVALAVGIAVGAGLLAPDALRPLPGRLLAYLPNVLVAGLMLIAGYAAATLTAAILSGGLARATGRTRRQAALGLRTVIMIAVVLLALDQLGVDTTLLTIAAAALLFGTATALALLIGLGGRDLAREIAAGRYLHRILKPGDRVEAHDLDGRVVTLHPATTEIETGSSDVIHVPHSHLLSTMLRVQRPTSDQRQNQPVTDEPANPTPRRAST